MMRGEAMAYGRLDVFWPDGNFQTFALNDDNISVGRSSGNTIMLERETISRYHCSIVRDAANNAVQLTDLASDNGTYVDGVRLAANAPRLLRGGEEIIIGDLRLIYHAVDDSPTQLVTALSQTQSITVEAPDFHIDVTGPSQAISPGAHISASLLITNNADETRHFEVEVGGLPDGWARIAPKSLALTAEEKREVVIKFQPPHHSSSTPGIYDVSIRVTCTEAPETPLEAMVKLHVLAFSGFGMGLEKKRITSGRFKLHLNNHGSGQLPLSIRLRDLNGDRLRFRISHPEVTLAPGQHLVVTGEVQPKQSRLLGAPEEYPFDVLVQSNDHAQFLIPSRARLVETPFLPTWAAATVVAGVVIGVVAVLIVLFVLLNGSPTPVISEFNVNATDARVGDTISLAWAVTDAEQLRLDINDTPFTTLDASDDNLSLTIAPEYLGEMTLTLFAINGDQRTSAERRITVTQALTIDEFVVEPTTVVRFIVQPLSVRWRATGAVNTRLDGLQNFSTSPVQTTFGASGSIEAVVGAPTDSFTLTLTAESSSGERVRQSITVEAVNPMCVAADEPVQLYIAPDETQQVVSTVPAGAEVVVNARDLSGAWLRALLPGDVSAWGLRDGFVCGGFNVDDLIPTDAPPPVTATP